MATLAAAALLDELMGRNRNVLPDDTQNQLNWDDPEVCKLYLVKLCPHDLFVNTRADLGPCSKIHDDEMKQHFDSQSPYRKQTYEDEFIRFCQSMLNEVERKIAKGKLRLSLNNKSEAPAMSSEQQQRNERQILLLSEKINTLVEDAEKAGIQGNVEQAQGLMKLCDELKEERETLRKQSDNTHWQQTAELAAAQEKQMEVCEICGAFLIVGDAQQRIDDHLMGKQHMGYAKLKSAVEEIMVSKEQNRQKTRDEREKKREEERKERLRLQKEEERKKEVEREERRKKRELEEEERRKRSKMHHRSRSPHHRGRSGSHRSGGGRDRYSNSSNYHDKSRHGNRHNSSDYRSNRDHDRHRSDRGMNGERYSRSNAGGGESGNSRGGSGHGGS